MQSACAWKVFLFKLFLFFFSLHPHLLSKTSIMPFATFRPLSPYCCHASLQNLKEVSPSPLPWPTGSSWGRTSRPIGWGALSRYWVFAQYCMLLVSISSFLCSLVFLFLSSSHLRHLCPFSSCEHLNDLFLSSPLSNTHHLHVPDG